MVEMTGPYKRQTTTTPNNILLITSSSNRETLNCSLYAHYIYSFINTIIYATSLKSLLFLYKGVYLGGVHMFDWLIVLCFSYIISDENTFTNNEGENVILGRTYCNKFRLVQTKTVVTLDRARKVNITINRYKYDMFSCFSCIRLCWY